MVSKSGLTRRSFLGLSAAAVAAPAVLAGCAAAVAVPWRRRRWWQHRAAQVLEHAVGTNGVQSRWTRRSPVDVAELLVEQAAEARAASAPPAAPSRPGRAAPARPGPAASACRGTAGRRPGRGRRSARPAAARAPPRPARRRSGPGATRALNVPSSRTSSSAPSACGMRSGQRVGQAVLPDASAAPRRGGDGRVVEAGVVDVLVRGCRSPTGCGRGRSPRTSSAGRSSTRRPPAAAWRCRPPPGAAARRPAPSESGRRRPTWFSAPPGLLRAGVQRQHQRRLGRPRTWRSRRQCLAGATPNSTR